MKCLFSFLIVSAFVIFNHGCSRGSTGNKCSEKDSLQWVSTNLGCLHIYTYKSGDLSKNPNLVIVLHGDAPFNNPGYHYRVAKMISAQNQNTIAIGLLRPGYTDVNNNKSDGVKGLTTGDNYTPEVIAGISQAIERLKTIYHPSKTVLVGHSGGSAITGDIIALNPGIVNAAVMVSCPCNVPEWRAYMGKKQPSYAAWRDSVTSVSPEKVAAKISKATEVVIISGEKDDVAPIEMSRDYYDQLRMLGIKSTFIRIPGEGHEILLNDSVFVSIKSLLSK